MVTFPFHNAMFTHLDGYFNVPELEKKLSKLKM